MAGAIEGNYFVGRKAEELRGLLKINYPVEHGVVRDWDDMEKIWSHIYTEELKALSEDHPVLLTEAPLNPEKNRDVAAQIFFETFNVPAMYLSIQAVLSLYASGRTTGMVLDSGDGVSHAVPVFEGFTNSHAIQRVDLAGRDVTDHLKTLLYKSGLRFETSAEFEIVRLIKEKTNYVAADVNLEIKEARNMLYSVSHLGLPPNFTTQNDQSVGMSDSPDTFILPDGLKIKLGQERFLAPEILFKPDLIGLEVEGLHELILNSVKKSDVDLRSTLLSNIVFSGGNTLMRGFGNRMLSEIRKASIADTKIKIYAPPERKYSTWIGGSILASLTEEYQDDPYIIHKKMF
ncbi:Actin-2 [Smittium mucronatum]|uniref:Actin-2 n=1 Tax=Smittium mucronatum TaxID=133383 RepID=A0A1R0GSA2_9FUNG|nr:Actin-2 [Smittium mucronatum]